ncbi:hypothetical protein SteCoe_15064 [Stentor coeruleus]|uniref:RING-type domain-containing protein n=1 Tax=Stentor coeruleus TaxID=5963 RepID=A0A1R2C4F5_9CILI|nr:hypothetical protein SteCoe_15064 [Stentor coeruleus]
MNIFSTSLSKKGKNINNNCQKCKNTIKTPVSERCEAHSSFCQMCIIQNYKAHAINCGKCHLNMKYLNFKICFSCLENEKTFKIPCCDDHNYCQECINLRFNLVDSLCKKCSKYFKAIGSAFNLHKCSICSENCQDIIVISRCHNYCKRCLNFSQTNYDDFFKLKSACLSCIKKCIPQLKYEEIREKEQESKSLEARGIKKCWICNTDYSNGILYKTPKCAKHNYCEKCLVDNKNEVYCNECKQYFSSIMREIDQTNMTCALCTMGGDIPCCSIHIFCRNCKDFMTKNDFSKYHIFRSCQTCFMKFQSLNPNFYSLNSGNMSISQPLTNINYISQQFPIINNKELSISSSIPFQQSSEIICNQASINPNAYLQSNEVINNQISINPNRNQSILINNDKKRLVANPPSVQSISKILPGKDSQFHSVESESPNILKTIKSTIDLKKSDVVEVQRHIDADLQEGIVHGVQIPLSRRSSIQGFILSNTTLDIIPVCTICRTTELYSSFLCNHNFCFECLMIYAALEIYNFFENYQSNKLITNKKFEYKCPVNTCRYNIKVPTSLVLYYLIGLRKGEFICKKSDLYMMNRNQLELIAGISSEWIPFFDGLKYNSVYRFN